MDVCNLRGASHSYGQVTVSWDVSPDATYYEYEYVDQENTDGCRNSAAQGYPWTRVRGTSFTLNVGQAVTVCVRAVKDEQGDSYNLTTGEFARVDVTPQ